MLKGYLGLLRVGDRRSPDRVARITNYLTLNGLVGPNQEAAND